MGEVESFSLPSDAFDKPRMENEGNPMPRLNVSAVKAVGESRSTPDNNSEVQTPTVQQSPSPKKTPKADVPLPWPGSEEVANDTRKYVMDNNVPWHLDKDIKGLYEIVSPLGTGGFAKVYKGKQIATGDDVAIKHIAMVDEGDKEVVYKEIKHLTMLKDVKQVVDIFEVFQHGTDAYIVMELCKGGELHASFESSSSGAFTYGDVGRIAVCMLIIVDAMHSRGVVHCDLKPENFCLVEPFETGKPFKDNLRLIDFGLSQRVRGGQGISGLAGSIPYMAPEIKRRMYDHKVDVWSIGVIIYTLLNGRLPFDGVTSEQIMARAATRTPDVSKLHSAVADFVKWLLTKDPKKRPEAREALAHPWLKITAAKSETGDAVMQSVSNEVIQNLSIFAASNKLQRAFMHLAVGFVNKTEMSKMLTMFSTLNSTTDQTQPMPAAEITELLCKGRCESDCEGIQRTVELVMGRNGELTIDDFIVASMNQYRNLSDIVIKTMFAHLDSDKDGWITSEDAYEALQPTGVHISVKELTKLFDKYGVKRRMGDATQQSGLMTYLEFHELMMPSVSQRFTHDLDGVLLAFRAYSNNKPFKKLILRILAENAPAKEIERIQRAFKSLDLDSSGTLTKEQLSRGVRDAGYVVSDADLDRLFVQLDTDETGLVRYHEFVAGAIDANILLGEGLLRWLFDFMDADDTDTINRANMERTLEMLDWSAEQQSKVWQAACGPDGTFVELSFDQFKALIQDEGGHDLPTRVQAAAQKHHDPSKADIPPDVFNAGPTAEWDTSGLQTSPMDSTHNATNGCSAHALSGTRDYDSDDELNPDGTQKPKLLRVGQQCSPENSRAMSRGLSDGAKWMLTHVRQNVEPVIPTDLPSARSSPAIDQTGASLHATSSKSTTQCKSAPGRGGFDDDVTSDIGSSASSRYHPGSATGEGWRMKSAAPGRSAGKVTKLKEKFKDLFRKSKNKAS